MINHDGSVLLSPITSVFIKITDIQFVEGGFELYGLEEVKPFVIYFKNHKQPITLPFMSSIRAELVEAIKKFAEINDKRTFLLLRNGYFVDMNEIVYTAYTTDYPTETEPSPKLFFRDGSKVVVTDVFYNVLLSVFKEAMELDTKKNKEV